MTNFIVAKILQDLLISLGIAGVALVQPKYFHPKKSISFITFDQVTRSLHIMSQPIPLETYLHLLPCAAACSWWPAGGDPE